MTRANTIFGHAGVDLLYGGAGGDRMWGGTGGYTARLAEKATTLTAVVPATTTARRRGQRPLPRRPRHRHRQHLRIVRGIP